MTLTASACSDGEDTGAMPSTSRRPANNLACSDTVALTVADAGGVLRFAPGDGWSRTQPVRGTLSRYDPAQASGT